MSRYKGNNEKCPHCQIKYKAFRTQETYESVRLLMWDDSTDTADWKYKRRGTVLGKWFQIKQELWSQHIHDGWCHEDPRNKPKSKVKRSKKTREKLGVYDEQISKRSVR
jgi:hypothetical protein